MKVHVLGTMGSRLIQGSDFHFNFLLSGVDVCGEWHGGPTARPSRAPHYLLTWNPGDLGSVSGVNATPAGSPYQSKSHQAKQPRMSGPVVFLFRPCRFISENHLVHSVTKKKKKNALYSTLIIFM